MKEHQAEGEHSLLAWSLLAILSLIWGSSFILIKKGLAVFNAGEVGSLRIVAAGLFLLPFAIRNLKKVKSAHWYLLFAVGLCGSFIPAFLFAKAQTRLDSSVTGVLNALTPLFTLLIGFFFFKQSIGRRKWLGILIGFAGTIWLALNSKGGIGELNAYVLYVILATILYGTNLNLIKYRIRDLKAVTITSISLVMLLPFALIFLLTGTGFMDKMNVAEGAWLALFYVSLLGIMGTAIALILFNRLVQISTPIFTSSVTYLIPIVAIAWGVLDGEVLLWSHYTGILAILVGVYFAGRSQASRNPDSRR